MFVYASQGSIVATLVSLIVLFCILWQPSLLNLATVKGILALNKQRTMSISHNALSFADTPNGQDAMPPPPIPSPSHGRSSSQTAAIRNMKRLSLSFPVQGGLVRSPVRHHPPPSVTDTATSLSIRSPLEDTVSNPPTDTNSFLTALATQERRVMELKEELQKAELGLQKLKRQWAIHEASKKRNELRHVEPLQPITSSPTKTDTEEPDARERGSRELELRRASYVGTKPSQRTVFSGPHTRTLSLLSPQSLGHDRIVGRLDGFSNTIQQDARGNLSRAATFSAPGTTVDPVSEPSTTANNQRNKGPTRDAVLETGKQMVGDFKEGLWTFIEDLRQATVGDEAVSGHGPRQPQILADGKSTPKQNSNNKPRSKRKSPPSRHINEPGSSNASPAPVNLQNSVKGGARSLKEIPTRVGSSVSSTIHVDSSDEDGWDNWESPAGNRTSGRVTSPLTEKSSPRTSVRCVSNICPR